MNPARLSRAILTSILFTATLSIAGCKPDAAVQKAEVIGRGSKPASAPPQGEPQSATADAPATAPALPTETGAVTGTISFTGKPPARVRIDTSMDPACSMSGGDVYSEQFAVTSGKLANVFVYVKSGPPAAMQPRPNTPPATVLDQKGCQYIPHVIGVVQGGFVEFHNSDPTMHNIHTMPTAIGNETVDVSQGPRGAPQTKQFRKPELMMPVRCNNHPWMNAFINVSETPFFAVSDAAGHFDLRGLPPGDYVLGAVHEKLGEKTLQVTIKPQSTAKEDLSFSTK